MRDYLNMPKNSETVQIWRTRKTEKKFFVVIGAHPSWHLVSGGWQAARRDFKRDMDLVRVLSKMDVNEVALLDRETLNAKIGAELENTTQEYNKGVKCVQDALFGWGGSATCKRRRV